jgi:hypothetical protein
MLDTFADFFSSLPGPKLSFEKKARDLPLIPRILVYLITIALLSCLVWVVVTFTRDSLEAAGWLGLLGFVLVVGMILLLCDLVGSAFTHLFSVIWKTRKIDRIDADMRVNRLRVGVKLPRTRPPSLFP